MFRSAVRVHLAGDVDRARLDALRAALRLKPEGRFDDAWDEIQGERIDEVPGGRLKILLFREDVPGPWEFRIHAEGEPPTDALQAVEEELAAAARAIGLTVTETTRRR
jgi:hypothetical protein